MNRAFTILEMIIAVGLGLVLVLAIWAGFRSTVQAVTATNRLALENQLMRAGVIAALNEADWWDLYDDRGDAALQRLRGVGMPFAPMQAAVDGSAWNGDEPWLPSDPRTWARGNPLEPLGERDSNGDGVMEKRNSQWETTRPFGSYGLFAHLKDAPKLGRFAGAAWTPYGSLPGGFIDADRRWLALRIEQLSRTLGHYGLLDHLPSNILPAVPGDPGQDGISGNADDADGAWHPRFLQGGTWNMGAGDGYSRPNAVYIMTKDQSFFVCPPAWYTGGTPNAGQLREWHWSAIRTGRHTNTEGYDNVSWVRARAQLEKPLLAAAPEHWPEVRLSVLRSVTYQRFTNVYKVRWTSPLTGELVELSFAAPGTTLRGARRQRGLE